MDFREAQLADLSAISRLLEQQGLMNLDCHQQLENFDILERAHLIIPIGALEVRERFGLIRSIAVDADYQGNGFGAMVLARLRARAADLGLQSLYLLTEEATGYFKRAGFSVVSRDQAPASILSSRQVLELCPSYATLMSCTV